MDEIIGAAGMSSSTVYRYFPEGKGSLIRAVLERATDPVLTWVAELAERPELPDAGAALLDGVRRTLALEGLTGGERGPRDRDEGAESASLIAYAWVEMSRDPRVREESARRRWRATPASSARRARSPPHWHSKHASASVEHVGRSGPQL